MENKQTKTKEKTAVEQFTAYLEWCEEPEKNFWEFPVEKLDDYLATFWFNVRTQKCELYKGKSLKGIRYSLNRALKEKGLKYDITSKNSPFTKSLKAFEDAKKELKKEGKGFVNHRPEIPPKGRSKISQKFYHSRSVFLCSK